jgi:hypothetical protein
MKIKGQSRDARELRLIFGRCPIHGVVMRPIDWAFGSKGKTDRLIVECPRCKLRGDAIDLHGPVVLFRDHVKVLEEPVRRKTRARK